MFRWNFDHSTWFRFYACVIWILDSYVTQPTCCSFPYREAYFHRDTHHWLQKEYAHKNFRHTKPLSHPLTRRPWEEATFTPVCLCLTFRYCTRNQGWVVAENSTTPQQHCQVAERERDNVACLKTKKKIKMISSQSCLSWWRTSQNISKNIIFTKKNGQKN